MVGLLEVKRCGRVQGSLICDVLRTCARGRNVFIILPIFWRLSPQEAGVKAGDELLGVEELDFEAERWDIDQLVSYMRELAGVVILHVMRGSGALARASPIDEEALMSYGVVPSDENANRATNGTAEASSKKLLQVLEEEELLAPSEAVDTSRLHFQISDRARQWDTGELWLSVAGLARRPSPQVVAAFANRWRPGQPPGWDESESSEEGEGEEGAASQRSSGGTAWNQEPNGHRTETEVEGEQGSDPADLDTIGAALLGQPLFSDTISAAVAAQDKIGGYAAGPSSDIGVAARESPKGPDGSGNHDWSPWPQLATLEEKAAQRPTVVPTQGLRKALSVRVLGQVDPTEAVGGAQVDSNDSSNAPVASGDSIPYIVWVMDVESGAEWRVRRTHSEFAELWEVCTGMRPSLARLDFPSCLPNVKETPGIIEARRPR